MATPVSPLTATTSRPTTCQPSATAPSISEHAGVADAQHRRTLGRRVRQLHARIGRAHHQAEGMPFSRALLAGAATPLQLAALIRNLAPAYALLESRLPAVAAALGSCCYPWPWPALERSAALRHDQAILASLPATPPSAAAAVWLEQLRVLADQAPHRLMAHAYVRYGGDLSGGQQLAEQARQILERHDLPNLNFWVFDRPTGELKSALHEGFEQLQLSDQEEQELLEEAELAFGATQSLLAELALIR
ncbi:MULTISPECIES: biliverdin-producing heme oxygenase [Aphanothece]|uniref:biliverdin-producing heme oxygenase n=1 Tax=Aphanothece TaxID=1121 RepID=UPI003984A52B